MKKISTIALITMLVTPMAASAQWSVGQYADSMTDEITKFAVTTNKDGHRLKIVLESGVIRAIFELNESSPDKLSAMLMYRIDKQAPEVLNDQQLMLVDKKLKLEFPTISTRKRLAFFLGFVGPANYGRLRNIMEGKLIVIRYYPVGGGEKETAFDLVGAKVAIASALNIPAEADQAVVARNQVLREATDSCFKSNDIDYMCIVSITNCDRTAKDLSELRRCLAEFDKVP